MTIKSNLLNKTLNVSRKTSSSENFIGEPVLTDDTDAPSSIRLRITRNKLYGESLQDHGIIVNSTHKGFCNTGHNLAVGDYLVDTNGKYRVDYIDDIPAGEIDHHTEMYLTYVED